MVCGTVLVLLFALSSSAIIKLSVSDEVASAGTNAADVSPMKGMTITAWSAEAYNSANFDESIVNLANVGADWVTFTVFWFMNTSSTTQIYRRPDLYTSSDSSLIHAIQKAHGLNMNVALKPMVDVVDGSWRGTINPSNWTLWFENYRNFTNYYADLARTNNVELFTVGTELRSSQTYESEWRKVINETRTRFSWNVTYAANWDSYSTFSRLPQYAAKFWDALDYVGVDAYFPLTNTYNPTLEQLKGAWSNSTATGWWGTGFNWTNELYSTYTGTGKKIVFTEIGYISQNGTNTQPWTGFTPAHEIDLQEQADCYQACLEVFKDKAWFMGWFWWNWETDPNAGGQYDDWYTPQNKPAQNVLYQYYSIRTITFQATGANVPITLNYTHGATSGSLAIPVGASNSTTIPYNSTISFGYESPVSGGSGTRFVLLDANASSPLTNVVDDTTVIGRYETQYLLTVLTDPAGLSPQPTRNPSGEAGPANGWWYNASTDVTLTAQTATGYMFKNWDVDGASQGSGVNPITVTVNASHATTAHYALSHDVALTNITLTKTVVSLGYSMNISIIAENAGYSAEAFNVTAYVNTTIIATFMNVSLTSGNAATLNFTWDTSSCVKGNYAISAYASPVSGETDTANNNCTDGLVKVSIPGDVVDPYFKVDMGDISAVLDAFGSKLGADGNYWHTPPKALDPHSPNMDIDGNGQVDMGDVVIALDHFGQIY